MVEVAVIHIGASYTEHLEHFQALHAFRRRKEHVVGACVVSCTAFLSLLFCLRRAPPSAGYIRLRRRFSRCRISPGIKKSGLFEPGNAKCIKKRRREREVGGVREEAWHRQTKRDMLCSMLHCTSKQQTGQWAGTEEGMSLVLAWCTSHCMGMCVCWSPLKRHNSHTAERI